MQMEFSEDKFIKNNFGKLDYSLESLIFLEKFLICSFDDHDSLRKDVKFLNFSCQYLGDCFIEIYGGSWDVEKDKKNVFYNLRVVKKDNVKICPLTLISAAVNRKKGDYLYKVIDNYKKYIDQK